MKSPSCKIEEDNPSECHREGSGLLQRLSLEWSWRKMVNARSTMYVVFSIWLVFCAVNGARASSSDSQKGFEDKISAIAETFIGTPYGFGKTLEDSGAVDNSQLFCLIYEKAASQAGMRFVGYMPMKDLLARALEVKRSEVRNGDLMVLSDGLAAMVYKIKNTDKLYLIYASFKRQEVISFNSENVVFDVYWLKNLKGFYRLSGSMFLPANR